jgi:hypothetical protein
MQEISMETMRQLGANEAAQLRHLEEMAATHAEVLRQQQAMCVRCTEAHHDDDTHRN